MGASLKDSQLKTLWLGECFVLLFGAVSCTGTSQNTGANSVEASTAEEPDSAEKGNEKKEEASAAPDTTTTTDTSTETDTSSSGGGGYGGY